MEQNGYADAGTLKISEDVLATIAGMAAGEIRGVAGLSLRPNSDLKGLFPGKKGPGKAIRLEFKDGEAVIEVFVNLYMGVKIPDVAADIQARIKEAVQNMTGITVSKVNVHITGVIIDRGSESQE